MSAKPLLLKKESEARELFSSIKVPRDLLERKLPEWKSLEKLAIELTTSGQVEVLDWASDGKYELPLMGFSFGSRDPQAPVLGIYGGVHGLERIGSQVVLAFMNSFAETLLWDKLLQQALSQIRIAFFPMVNPWGMYHVSRANPFGIDLMRNAPLDAEEPTWLVGGQRISPRLPWYRGPEGSKMQTEAQALVDFTTAQLQNSSRVITLDFHSGFGIADQIWFPYAKTKTPFPHLAELHAFKEAFERTHPHHFYKIEPQAKNYTTHGDLWDYLYDQYLRKNKRGVYLPMAIEMGSWLWVKKNPSQMFSALGPFNPMVPHRQKRILRRHNTLLDFTIRSLVSPDVWIPKHDEQRLKHQTRAQELWYAQPENG